MTRTTITRNWGGKCTPVADVIFDDAPEVIVIKVAPVVRVLQVAPWIEPDALDYCLECWKQSFSGGDRDLGVKTMSGLVGDGNGGSSDVHADQYARDQKIAEATDAMVDSLSQLHGWAIYRSCSIATPWNFPNADLVSVAVEARHALTLKLKNNPCTGILF